MKNLLERMRGLEIDHEPDGCPAVRMREISALCDEIERLRGVVNEAATAMLEFADEDSTAMETQFVFLTGERNPIPIEDGDRRFLVTPL